jgi:hypothetical protein
MDAAGQGAGISEEAALWGFRLLAGRPPADAAELAAFRALPDLEAMRRAFTNTWEYHAFFGAVLTGFPAYAVPGFLLRPPAIPGLDWSFREPDLDDPGCQLRTAAQLSGEVYQEIAQEMGLAATPGALPWEEAWITSVLATAGLIGPGRTLLAIEPGRERVAALLASRGTGVLGLAAEPPGRLEARRAGLFHPEILTLDEFDGHVGFGALDPRELGRLPAEYDGCFSVGLPDRLGSVAAALDAIEASLLPLRPGGLAAHAFRFNLSSDTETWELPGLVLLRRRDIEALAARLHAVGHRLLPLTTHPGGDPADERVKSDPGGPPGHRQRHGFAVATGFGLAIRKAG